MASKEAAERITPRTASGNPRNIERTGVRCTAYSTWHRKHPGLRMIDLDSIEVCRHCKRPLACIETARRGGKYTIHTKPTTLTRHVAEGLQVPGYVLFYETDAAGTDLVGIVEVRQIAPLQGPLQRLTPAEWSELLVQIHEAHERQCARGEEIHV